MNSLKWNYANTDNRNLFVYFCICLFIAICFLSGCQKINKQADEECLNYMITEDSTFVNDMEDIYRSLTGIGISTEADKHKKAERIMQLMGEKGYIAVDISNQINMTNCDITECF